MFQLSKACQTIKTRTKYFLTKIFLWKFCLSCSTIVTIQKIWVLLLKNIIIQLKKGFQTVKTERKYFLTKIFCRNFVEIVQQSLPSRKLSFIALKHHFLTHKRNSNNKYWDEIIFDKYFLIDQFVPFLFDLNKFFLHANNP